jgi:hypothetical protein
VACAAGPDVSESGLVLALDGANYKSFKGVPATNILNQITSNYSDQSSSLFKVTNGSETVLIPSLGYVTSKYVDFYNDYNGGSGNCCPSLFTYGTGLAVSPSTTYTYSIIYKTTTGYSHPNYMYRYEFNSGGTYLTEGGVHSEGNRTSLGDGWWFAWGQFTTQATAATLATYLFHYEYATQNRVYVYRAALYAGTYVIPPEHMLTSGQVRGTTVATGGGWADLTGNGNHGELVNGVKESGDNLGSLVFDGTNDYIEIPFETILNDCSIEVMFKATSTRTYQYLLSIGSESTNDFSFYLDMNDPDGSGFAQTMWAYWNSGGTPYSIIPKTGTYGDWNDSTWRHYVFVRSSTTNHYMNGNLVTNVSRSGDQTTKFGNGSGYKLKIGTYRTNSNYFPGNIASVKIYNRALTAAEVQQNFNAKKSRFGL